MLESMGYQWAYLKTKKMYFLPNLY